MWTTAPGPPPLHPGNHPARPSQIYSSKKILVHLFGRLIKSKYFALAFMSYVAEWQGGGPHDLLRGFDSLRNCYWQQWLDLNGVVSLHCPFGLPLALSHLFIRIDQPIGRWIMRFDLVIILQLRQDLPRQLFAQLNPPLIKREDVPDHPLHKDLMLV